MLQQLHFISNIWFPEENQVELMKIELIPGYFVLLSLFGNYFPFLHQFHNNPSFILALYTNIIILLDVYEKSVF